MRQRTGHSLGGMRRYTQMSKTRVFIFVEGRDLDPDVYGRLCDTIFQELTIDYEIVVADRIAGQGGGKSTLIKYFEFLESNNSLLDTSQPDYKLSFFYLDKDVDDLLGQLRQSAHVVYTQHYCIENYLFIYGDLVSGLATAGSFDISLIRRHITDQRAWMNRAAICWQEWVSLCLLATKLHLPIPASYRLSQSRLNTPVDATTDQTQLADLVSEMEQRSQLSQLSFQRKLKATYKVVNTIYANEEFNRLFKGKWYIAFALRQLELASTGQPFNRNNAADRLWGSLIATMHFDDAWADHFRIPLREALNRL